MTQNDQQPPAGWWLASDGRWYPPTPTPGPAPSKRDPKGCLWVLGTAVALVVLFSVAMQCTGTDDRLAMENAVLRHDDRDWSFERTETDGDCAALEVTQEPLGVELTFFLRQTGGEWEVVDVVTGHVADKLDADYTGDCWRS